MKLLFWLKDFSKTINNKQKSTDNKFKDFLKVSDNNLNLNFVFDNLKNYTIAAGVLYVGITIFKTGSFLFKVPTYNVVVGSFIILSGLSLMLLNLLQGISATLNKKRKMLFVILINILNISIIFSAMEIFWFQVNKLLGK